MIRFRIPPQLSLIITALLFVVTFLYDLLRFYSGMDFGGWVYLHEGLSAATIFFFYLYLTTRPIFRETSVRKNLLLFIKTLALFYLIVLIFKFTFNPSYSLESFPPVPQSIPAVIYANLISIVDMVFMSYLLVVIKNLVYYKYKKRTNIYAILALIFVMLTVFSTVYYKPSSLFTFSDNGLISDIFMLITLIFLVLLSFRNSWVTYLSRKEKYSYFLVGSLTIWPVIILLDLAFQEALQSHSIALNTFLVSTWFFLVFYSSLAAINLLLHLPTARVFDRKMKEVSSLHHLSSTISLEYDTKKLANTIIEMSSEVLESPYTWLELYDPETNKLHVASSKNLMENEISLLNQQSDKNLSRKILNDKKSIVINELPKSEVFSVTKMWNHTIGSLVGVPLVSGKGTIFGILFAAKSQIFGFDPDDVNMLEAYANQAAIALENANLLKTSFEQERLEKELQIAREVQLRLLPQTTPKYEHVQIEAMMITAYEVGGDYYDFYTYPDNRFGMIIGDVSGKGTSAAFYMAETKGVIQSLARSYESPREILIQTNNLLYSTMDRKSFISLLAVRFDLENKHVCFSRAGHCPVVYYEAATQKTKLIQPPGIAVGLDEGKLFTDTLQEFELEIKPNDILAFYTDGLSEARNGRAEEFGEERLCEAIRENAHMDVYELKDAILDRILKFLNDSHLHDDLTLVLTKIT